MELTPLERTNRRLAGEPVDRAPNQNILMAFAARYIGSTYDEPIPTAFLDDVLTGSKPVVWIINNIWQLQARTTADAFVARYGFATQYFSFAKFTKVTYGPHTLTRDGEPTTDAATV